jgi:7-carboxy-7-deazaguanine synthase (Cx14CxxC type)
MAYSVKEIFYSLQGEGANSGRPAVFCRFAGCNLWSGREQDRASATCGFCDTDFVGTDGRGGGEFASADELLAAIRRHDRAAIESDAAQRPLVVFTGGEPLLQLDPPLISRLHDAGYQVAIETNGTLPAPAGVDWICVSPKAGAELQLRRGDELKLVFPQEDLDPESLEHLDFRHFFLQPMDGPRLAENTHAAIEYCLRHPRWRLSLQTHKILGLR